MDYGSRNGRDIEGKDDIIGGVPSPVYPTRVDII